MVFVGILGWWYGAGLRTQTVRIQAMLASVYDYFSIDLLLRTLFSPFRQISAGKVRGPLAVQMRAFVDRLFSRVIGAVFRLIMIVIGTVACVCVVMIALIGGVLWLCAPFLPIIGLAISMSGWVPWQL